MTFLGQRTQTDVCFPGPSSVGHWTVAPGLKVEHLQATDARQSMTGMMGASVDAFLLMWGCNDVPNYGGLGHSASQFLHPWGRPWGQSSLPIFSDDLQGIQGGRYWYHLGYHLGYPHLCSKLTQELWGQPRETHLSPDSHGWIVSNPNNRICNWNNITNSPVCDCVKHWYNMIQYDTIVIDIVIVFNIAHQWYNLYCTCTCDSEETNASPLTPPDDERASGSAPLKLLRYLRASRDQMLSQVRFCWFTLWSL